MEVLSGIYIDHFCWWLSAVSFMKISTTLQKHQRECALNARCVYTFQNTRVKFYVSELNIGFTDIEEFLCEATLTRGFDHPNVLKIIGVAIDKRDCFMVLPFMENGSLRDFLLDTQNVSLLLILYKKIFQLKICNNISRQFSSVTKCFFSI